MLPFGHSAVGYLISQAAKPKLKAGAVWLIVAAANVFDLDFLVLTALGIPGGRHHYYPGHTPLMGLIYWLVIYFIFRSKFSRRIFILVALALLSLLIIDDFSYWLTLIGLEKNVPSQINWLFPLTQKSALVEPLTNGDILRKYLIETPKLFYLEIMAVISALIAARIKK